MPLPKVTVPVAGSNSNALSSALSPTGEHVGANRWHWLERLYHHRRAARCELHAGFIERERPSRQTVGEMQTRDRRLATVRSGARRFDRGRRRANKVLWRGELDYEVDRRRALCPGRAESRPSLASIARCRRRSSEGNRSPPAISAAERRETGCGESRSGDRAGLRRAGEAERRSATARCGRPCRIVRDRRGNEMTV